MNERIRKSEKYLDQIRGSLFGGAVGDALGYAVEFLDEGVIFDRYGENGIRDYELDPETGKALISDDTQMSLFTANGILVGDTRGCLRGIMGPPSSYIAESYQDWLWTQDVSFEYHQRQRDSGSGYLPKSWLCDVPELFIRRAPGTTCLSALRSQEHRQDPSRRGYGSMDEPPNDRCGCGGVMRVAPLGMMYAFHRMNDLDMEGASIAAITHGHPLGYMPAAVLVHIISRSVYGKRGTPLKEIVLEARNTTAEIFNGEPNLEELLDIIDGAIDLSEKGYDDLDCIHQLGQGWVAHETLGIAVYCALKHCDDFSAGIIAAVNHEGDSDSTGAVTGNILGAYLGYKAIEEKWKQDLEIADVILEMADDLCHGCMMSEYSSYVDPDWERKYIEMRWKK